MGWVNESVVNRHDKFVTCITSTLEDLAPRTDYETALFGTLEILPMSARPSPDVSARPSPAASACSVYLEHVRQCHRI